jgi:hypothetical protein
MADLLTLVQTDAPIRRALDPNRFDVRAYGALGNSNGTTGNGANDLPAFTAAVAAAKAAGGGVVWVPPGTYRLPTATLLIDASNISIEGTGRLFFDSTDILSFGRILFDGGVTSGTIRKVGVRGITVFNRAGVEVAGFQPGYNGCACLVTFRGCEEWFAERVECFNSPNYCISTLRASNGMVDFCILHDSVADGVHMQEGSCYNTVQRTLCYRLGDDGLAVGGWGAANNIGNRFIDNVVRDIGGRGIVAFTPTTHLLIANNTIERTFSHAIMIESTPNFDVAANYIRGVIIKGNIVERAGFFNGFARTQDYAVGVSFKIQQGAYIDDVVVDGNVVRDVRNSFLMVTPVDQGGPVRRLVINANVFDNIAATGGTGTADVTGGGGIQFDTPSARRGGIDLSAFVERAVITSNLITSSAGAPIVNAAQQSIEANNMTSQAAGVIASDTFNRADVAPAVGAVGSTSTGNKLWKGTAWGIASNKLRPATVSSGDFPAIGFDAGVNDFDVSVTVTLGSQQARLFGAGQDPSGGVGANGRGIFMESGGTIYYASGSGYPIIANFTAIPLNSTHTMRLVRKGSNLQAYVDGAQVANVTNLPAINAADTFVGLHDATSNGTNRFDDFSVTAAP